MRRKRSAELLVFLALLPLSSCVFRPAQLTQAAEDPVELAALWQQPADLEHRDLLAGPKADVDPPPVHTYTLLDRDDSGGSVTLTVQDVNGAVWEVKLGVEAQPEVVVSRLLWAIGFHQPPIHYVEDWQLQGMGAQPPARFRAQSDSHRVVDEWSWYENPFVHTQPFRGLLVANLIVNNWDFRTSNNRIYEVRQPNGAVERRYVVRDLGASLGRSRQRRPFRWFPIRGAQGTKNDLEAFEEQGFILGATANDVELNYRGLNAALIDSLTPGDVVWACTLMSRLSDHQWDAAFRAARYDGTDRARYIRKIKSKLGQGLRLSRTRS